MVMQDGKEGGQLDKTLAKVVEPIDAFADDSLDVGLLRRGSVTNAVKVEKHTSYKKGEERRGKEILPS